ncbi:MAG: glyoxylate/hydroxypyruvate reductase A [Rhodospirillales bacterium]|nr:glyoxylate/hydroxypyruvate reductase A [Rhodospirillales bacterium]
MALLFSSQGDDADLWRHNMATELPDLDFRVWTPDGQDIGDANDIEYALVWKPRKGALKEFQNLKAIFSLGAGVDHLAGADLPKGVPVVRLVDRGLTQGMSEYVAYWVLHHHRRFDAYADMIAENGWQRLAQKDAHGRRVGIMGLGVLGRDALEKLKPFEFDLAGWSRTPKTIPGVKSFAGEDGLQEFLKRTEILVCLLPLTPETTSIINAQTLALLPEGAYLINAARGGHVVDNDLIEALDSGHIGGATLDVFHTEPLPDDHPFRAHPKVHLTPHIASITMPETAARAVADNIRRIRKGEPPEPVVDPETGY